MTSYKMYELSKRIFSGGTPSTNNASYWGGDIPWLSSGETAHQFIYQTERMITNEGVNNSSTRLARVNSVVIASAGQGNTRGQASFLKINTYINQSIVAIEPDENKVLPLYLYYLISTKYDDLRLLSNSSSTRGSLTTKSISNFEVNIHDKPKQQHIVNTISTLPLISL